MTRTFGLAEFLLILAAVRWTILLSLVAFVGGGILGFVVAIMRTHRSRILRILTAGYIQAFQGTPVLMQLFLFYYGFAVLFDVQIDAWPAVALAFTLYSGAFLGEIWRGSIEAIPRTQWEASACLSLGYFQQLRFVILPQAMRISIPPTVGFLVQLVKGTSIAAIVGFRRTDPRRAAHGQRDLPADDHLPAGRGHLLCDVLAAFAAESLTRKAHRCRSWH